MNRILRILLLSLCCCLPLPAWAGGIAIKSADVVADESLRLWADAEINLNPTLEEALNKGVMLHFLVEFELLRPRNWWLDEDVLSAQQYLRVSYNALTRQYLLIAGDQHLAYSSLVELRQGLGALGEWLLAERSPVKKRTAYRAGLRIKLDLSLLPKPLQVNAIGARDWDLASDWHYWNLAY